MKGEKQYIKVDVRIGWKMKLHISQRLRTLAHLLFSIFKACKLRISFLSKEICSSSIKNFLSLCRIAQINSIASRMQASTNFHLFLKFIHHSSLFQLF